MYRSGRFLDVIRDVIETHLSHDCEILLSDQHGLDDAIDQLRRQFSDYQHVRFFASTSALNWVQNINLLIRNIRSDFFRIAPHDDSTTGAQSDHLNSLLRSHPDAVLASGAVHLLFLDGDQESHISQSRTGDGLSRIDVLKEFNWSFLYNGAFKGMIRKSAVTEHDLYIVPTPTTIWSERLWLNALRMLGPFVYSPEVMHTKRLYADSTHRRWKHTRQVALDSATVMDNYIDRLISSPADRRELKDFFWQKTYLDYLDRAV